MSFKLPAFSDVQQIMEEAIARGGVRFRVSSWGKAVNMRQRCYRFRKAQQKLAREQLGFVPGVPISTPFDSLEITIEDQLGAKLIQRPTETKAKFDLVLRHREPDGEFLSLDGTDLPESNEPGLTLE